MTPRDKSLELTEKFVAPFMDRGLCGYVQSISAAKQCASIAVDEILKYFKHSGVDSNAYWEEVKKEIQKL